MKDQDIEPLLNDSRFSSVTKLSLGIFRFYLEENKLTFKGIAFLAKHQWKKLYELDLSTFLIKKGLNNIGNEGMVHLSAFPSLRILRLSNCKINQKGVEALSKH